MKSRTENTSPRANRTIVVNIGQEEYENIFDKAENFREMLDQNIQEFPELFPPEIRAGYFMRDKRRAKKLDIGIRRITTGSITYSIRPSFVTPYLTGFTQEVSSGLFLRKFSVPFWALAEVFGKDPMYWYRMEKSLGVNNIVGTTIKDPEKIPRQLVADEKHSKLKGKKVYIATTAGDNCLLGVGMAKDSGEVELTKAYGTFREEARTVNPDYAPETVTTDRWAATKIAWKTLFPLITLFSCFLHVFLKIRTGRRKKYKELYQRASDSLWNCYRAKTKRSFSQRVRRLVEWARKESLPELLLKPIVKLGENLSEYARIYDHPGAPRTSNMVDRPMQRMNQHLVSTKYFHGSIEAAEQSLRGWALIQNFAPLNPRTIERYGGARSQAERINKKRYHENWLENLYISASLGGSREAPQKTL